jgi:dUTP pyrophosphatase
MKVKLLHKDAKSLSKNPADAGYDLSSIQKLEIFPHSRETIKTGVAIELPMGTVGLIWPRSGMSVKKGIDVLAGVIDESYRGDIMVCLYNTSNFPVQIDVGDRIAQLLVQPVFHHEVEVTEHLSDTERNDNGFASSGW